MQYAATCCWTHLQAVVYDMIQTIEYHPPTSFILVYCTAVSDNKVMR